MDSLGGHHVMRKGSYLSLSINYNVRSRVKQSAGILSSFRKSLI